MSQLPAILKPNCERRERWARGLVSDAPDGPSTRQVSVASTRQEVPEQEALNNKRNERDSSVIDPIAECLEIARARRPCPLHLLVIRCRRVRLRVTL